MLLATPDEGYAGCCEAIAGMDLRPVLASITAPTLVVAGNDDPATPQAHARTIAAGINGAHTEGGDGSCRVEIVDGAHLATVENPDACTALMLEHLTADA
jgi:3-oxoadipate enol-lactonase